MTDKRGDTVWRPRVSPDLESSVESLFADDVTDPKNAHEGTARVANLAKLAHFALIGAAVENERTGYEGVLCEDIAMVSELLQTLWLASAATHRLVAGDKAVA
jgi:hypothetical protein